MTFASAGNNGSINNAIVLTNLTVLVITKPGREDAVS
jgi:hypothetical protein